MQRSRTRVAQACELRRNGQARVTQQAARQGRFAAPFAASRAASTRRHALRTSSPRTAPGGSGHRAGFVPWYGPVFWPYAYSDVFDYTFWPGGYDDGYWAYAYDDFFDGVFWGEAGPPQDYAYARRAAASRAAPRPSYAAVQELCKQPGSGVTAWPFADIERKVGLNAEQKQLLGDDAQGRPGCRRRLQGLVPGGECVPADASGPPDAMTARLDATLGRVQTVRPALEKFYASLSDEQKERFNEIGPKPSRRQCRGARRPRKPTELQGAEARPHQSADREDRGRGQADRRAGSRAERLEDATAKAVVDHAGGLPG